jgi:two-component system phosphate regulon sensor histidine kinase PhoR
MSDPRDGRTSLATRSLIYYALAYIVLIGLVGFFVERSARQALADEVQHRLETTARLAAENLPEDRAGLQAWASSAFQATGLRFTLIDLDGVVLADSHSDPSVMENHGTRPEVLAAKRGEIGVSRRISVSTGFEQMYLALPPRQGVITRVSLPMRLVEAELASVRPPILLIAAAAGLVGLALVAFLARRLIRPITEITEQSLAVAAGNLEVSPRRSRVRELDRLGVAISTVAESLGRRLEEAEEASRTLEVVLGALPQGTVLVDGDDRVIYANPSAYALLGVVPDELQGLSPYQFQTAVREARVSREPEVRTVDHGTPVRRLRAIATPFSEDERVLLVVVDVTERERAEAIRRDFVANASHELKTPVSTIIASAEALQIAVERGDRSTPGFARQIEESARQLDRMVGDLLDLSRLERETPDLAPVRLDLVVQDEVRRIEPTTAAKGVSVEQSGSEVLVAGNHPDLATAVRNLLDNAVRYTGEEGKIAVDVSVSQGEAVLTVTDDGEGIPSRDLDRVFERFYRVDSARSRATGGTGLGLAIVKHVAETHGGSVGVESELGVGSTFTMRIPLADSEESPGGH